MTQNGKLMPNLNLDQQSTKVLNLTVLQRIDPHVEEILITAAHVTFYEFNIELNQWSRKDVEGSLFVVKRNTQPRFQFIVMNRRNAENLVEDILGDFEYEIQPPYLLYRNAAQEVNGIWFYNQQECEAVAALFQRILSAFSKVPPKSGLSAAKSTEFEELEAVSNLAVMEGPLEPQTSSAASVPDAHIPDDSFVNFFTGAMNIGNAAGPNAAMMGPSHQSSSIPSSSHSVNIIPSAATPYQSSPSLPTLPIPLIPNEYSGTSSNRSSANLINPSLFAPPASSSAALSMPPIVSSSMPSAPPLQPPITMQRPYGTPLLQPFPPPTPPPSLTPAPAASYGPVITRDKVRDALLRLVQNDHFVDMVYREMMSAHYPQ
ncbi:uncharacterized protein A4U43_C09F900 [Asparagus officinalis]|uniref:WH1 domain-containing protein n=1 Tax=Asparagus officinalis TaxID=4686 RepID=A0A5P1E949_ASPOF|nr:mRNA-decapping enzyme-like protein isoform X1 [Asparagus officinalis]XP_020246062.1 mRNA-decapping enzyme-like protein isoform X2 [Asparagus officinalis]ONK57476.1 uncharacterized protein A4U43_C09F900 [Asparagus officinalis]